MQVKVLVVALALVVSACAYGPSPPVVTIAPGLHPRLTPAAVERLARTAIDESHLAAPGNQVAPSVLSITAIHGGPTVGGYLAGVSWLVRVRGDFIAQIGTHFDRSTRPAHAMTIQISDDDESVVDLEFTG